VKSRDIETHFEMFLGDLWTHVITLNKGVPESDSVGFLSEALEKVIVYARLDEDAGASTAALPLVPAK
jgi:hypothetical protein